MTISPDWADEIAREIHADFRNTLREDWADFKRLAKEQGLTISMLASQIASAKEKSSLSSAIRLYVLDAAKKQAA